MVKIPNKKEQKQKKRNSPFKLWDSFGKGDKKIFFGRDRESQLLYEKTFTSNLLLLYGASGTGKTSLIQCGLGNEFEDAEWLPISIRKGDNIIKSLSIALREHAVNEKQLRNNSIREKIHHLFLEQFRPVFLIFDQFEELFILGSKEEQISFFTLLPELLAANFQCKVILSIREDYLAYLDEFEDYVPTLFYNRLRLERMRQEQLEEVLRGTSDQLQIQLGNGGENEEQLVINEIITNVKNDLGKVDLADLQVYLDHLHKNDEIRKAESKDQERDIRFDNDLVKETGELEDVLGVLLAEELVNLEDQLEERGAAHKGIPKNVLAELVTHEGTKLTMEVDEIKERLNAKEGIKPKYVEYCIGHLIEMRILKDRKNPVTKTVEIAHDRLAGKIFSLIGGEKQKEKEIRQEIRNAYHSFQSRGALLDEKDLAYFGPYLERLILTEDQLSFIDQSRWKLRKQATRIRWITLGVIALLTLSVVATVWQWHMSNKLFRANNLSAAALHTVSFDRTKAYNLAEKALEIEENNQMASTLLNDILIQSNDFPFYTDALKVEGIEKFSDLAVTEDKKYLAAGSLDGKILFYRRYSSGNNSVIIFDSTAHHGMITDVDFARVNNVDFLVTSGKDSVVQVRKLMNDSLQKPEEFFHNGPVSMVNLSGEFLFSGTTDHILKWDRKNNSIPKDTFDLQHTTSFEVFQQGNSEQFLLAASRDSSIKLININKKELVWGEKIADGVIENMDIMEVSDHPNQRLLLAGLDNGKLLIQQLDNSFFTKVAQTWSPARDAHEDAINDVSLIRYENKKFTVLTSSRDKTAKLWEYCETDQKLVLLKTFLGHNDGVRAISHVKDGRKEIIFTGGEDQTIKKWILQSHPYQTLPGEENTINISSFVHTASGERILISRADGSLGLFHYGQTYSGEFEEEDILNLQADQFEFSKTTFSHSGDPILMRPKTASGKGGIISVMGTDTTQKNFTDKGRLLSLYSSPEKTKVLSSFDSLLLIWDLESKMKIDSFPIAFPADLAFFSPNGNMILVPLKGEEVVHWFDLVNKERHKLEDHTDEVLSVAFSPDGNYILTGSKDNRVILYQKKGNTIEKITSLQRHKGNVNSVAFSPDGKRFLSASEDGTLRIWKIEAPHKQMRIQTLWPTGGLKAEDVKEQKSTINLGMPIVKAAFLTNNKIITLDRDGGLKIWNSDFVDSKKFTDQIYKNPSDI